MINHFSILGGTCFYDNLTYIFDLQDIWVRRHLSLQWEVSDKLDKTIFISTIDCNGKSYQFQILQINDFLA